MPFVLAIALAILQHEPEIAGLIGSLFGAGRKVPTADEIQDVVARRAARILSQQQFERDAGGE